MRLRGDHHIALFYPMSYDVVPDQGSEELLTATLNWAVERGVVAPASPAERSLARMRSDLATALAYPDARGAVAQFISDFIGWYLLLDDELESSGYWDDNAPATMPALFTGYVEALADPHAPRLLGAGKTAELLRGAVDLGTRLRQLASPAWRTRFLESMRTYFFLGILPEAVHYTHRTSPSLTEYTALRIESSGSYPIFDLIEIASGHELPEAVATHRLIRAIRRIAAVTISWANDVMSFHKEETGPVDALNLPRLLMSDCGLSEQQAFIAAVGIHDAEMHHYLRLLEQARQTSALDQTVLRPWLRGLDIVMRGLLEWQFRAARYAEGRCLMASVKGEAPVAE